MSKYNWKFVVFIIVAVICTVLLNKICVKTLGQNECIFTLIVIGGIGLFLLALTGKNGEEKTKKKDKE